MKLPKGLKLFCARHGEYLKYHKGDYVCMYEGYCACITIIQTNQQEGNV